MRYTFVIYYFFISIFIVFIIGSNKAYAVLPPVPISPMCKIEGRILSSDEVDNVELSVRILDSNLLYSNDYKGEDICEDIFVEGDEMKFWVEKDVVNEFTKLGYEISNGTVIQFPAVKMANYSIGKEYFSVGTIFEYPDPYQLLKEKQNTKLSKWESFLEKVDKYLNNKCARCNINIGNLKDETNFYTDKENKVRFELNYGLKELADAQKEYNLKNAPEFIDKVYYMRYCDSLDVKCSNSYVNAHIMTYIVGGTEPDNSWIQGDEYYEMEYDRTIKNNRGESIDVYKRNARFEKYELFKYPISDQKAAYFIIVTSHVKAKNNVYENQVETIKSVFHY